ncbi:hypothetical protein AGRA3207_002440 [Actinomadura graeca]|uniref:Secreted protein n=1 Tax=Actinomadura graeca TaxID=2750812 RepID=A0ABX8QRY8_9ACTN|nr:hypothetical protein [Actinomadura graeca]QXJ21576.1 hypothetical protein AGRA3207_002440 [Actinomadura graeca]
MSFLARCAASALAVVVLTAGGSQAWGYTAKYGANRAYTKNKDRQVVICDGSQNKADVKVQYERSSGNGGSKWNRGDRGCSETGPGKTITQIRVCEAHWGPDPCGRWKYR